MCCLWDLNPIFTRRREAVKWGMPRGSRPHGLRPNLPLAGCVGSGHLGSCLVDPSVSIISQVFLITA